MLDLIFCSEEDLVSNVVVGECLAGSDHHMVWCMVGSNAGPEVVRPRDRLNLRRADYDGFCRERHAPLKTCSQASAPNI